MRLITWNVNGITTLPQYHPWNTNKDYQGIIDMMQGDIICIQETKITRQRMSEKAKGNARFSNSTMATMSKYDAFFSFYRSVPPRGIHGTAIYTKRSVCIPTKAEEGLSETYIAPSVPPQERIGGYPRCSDLDIVPDDLAKLDGEGRAVVLDLGMFVLINLYCPNETDEARLEFKNRYNELVDRRVRNLIKAGREVIVVGDLNICVNEIDSAEYKEDIKKRGIGSFTSHPPRKWLSQFVSDRGVMIDLTRHFHPGREGMFTCWNTKIEARVTNYGTRLDYILITPGLLPWIKFSDISPSVTGSDHCPVYADFYDEREIDGKTVKLSDLLTPGRRADENGNGPDPPAFATRFYEEFGGAKQKTLKTFFTKGAAASNGSATTSTSSSAALPPSVAPVSSSAEPSTFESTPKDDARPSLADRERSRSQSSSMVPFDTKPKQAAPENTNGQKTLASFFKPPESSSSSSKKGKGKRKARDDEGQASDSAGKKNGSKKKKAYETKVATSVSKDGVVEILDDDDEDGGAASSNAKSSKDLVDDGIDEAALAAAEEANAEQQAAWSNIFAKKEAPLCAHGEPCRLWTVNKPGPNKGRQFYQCARPVGPGYQRTRGGAATGEFRCGTWEWVGPNIKRPPGMVPYTGSSSNGKKK